MTATAETVVNSAKTPLVSVIVPVYNQEKYIAECVRSILGQDFPDLEAIIVDDGSADDTPRILSGFGDRIRVIRQENRGAGAALNRGLRAAKGELLAWIGSDDAYLPGALGRAVGHLAAHRRAAVLYGDFLTIDGSGRTTGRVSHPEPSRESFARTLMLNNFINGSTVLMRRQCLLEAGYYREDLRADLDADMWLRLLKRGFIFTRLAVPQVRYRRHATNVSADFPLMRTCKDRVRKDAVEQFTPEELFADLLAGNPAPAAAIGNAYAKLAWRLYRNKSYSAAEAAIRKGLRYQAPVSARLFLSPYLRFNNLPAITAARVFLKNRERVMRQSCRRR